MNSRDFYTAAVNSAATTTLAQKSVHLQMRQPVLDDG
jgi:hypothetical protein